MAKNVKVKLKIDLPELRAIEMWDAMDAVMNAFDKLYGWYAYENENSELFGIKRMFLDGTLIAQDYRSRKTYMLNWEISGGKDVVFTPREQWVEVEDSWQPGQRGLEKLIELRSKIHQLNNDQPDAPTDDPEPPDTIETRKESILEERKIAEKAEIRTLQSTIELREVKELGKKQTKIVGYALRFNQESQDLGGFIEVIDKDALKNADMFDVRALFNHDKNIVLGRTTSGTLSLFVDNEGLRYEITPPDTQYVRDMVIEPMRRGDISQSSFAFTITSDGDEWQKRPDGMYLRTITKISALYDVSPVTYPAYRQTDSMVRSLNKVKADLPAGIADVDWRLSIVEKLEQAHKKEASI